MSCLGGGIAFDGVEVYLRHVCSRLLDRGHDELEDRRIQTPTTPCIGEEPLFLGVGQRYDGNRQPVILS